MVTFIIIYRYEKLYRDNFFCHITQPYFHSCYLKRTNLHNAPANRWMPLEAKVIIPPYRYLKKIISRDII